MPGSEKSIELLIAADHGGYDLKEYVKANLKKYKWIDLGTDSKKSCDYPDYAKKMVEAMHSGPVKRGILICGTGIGMSIAANRFKGARAAVVTNSYHARMSRAHNDSNILCLGARVLGYEYTLDIVETWVMTPFEGEYGKPEGDRHRRRLEKIDEYTNTQTK